jgi:RNase P subunit RPR2
MFKELDPEVARRAVEGHEDILTPARERNSELYESFTCPRCKCSLTEEYDARTAFTHGSIVPKAVLVCGNCTYRIDPHTNVVINFGDASKVPVESIPIVGGNYLPDP